MSHIYDKHHERTDEYRYQINGGGKYNIKDKGQITIIFVDGKYSSSILPFNTPYTRNQWRIVADIEMEIRRIEENYETEEIKLRQYNHLLNAVSEKVEGESRYDTALRYIEEAEGYFHEKDNPEKNASTKDNS